eukprot:354124-Chlamydomonas_euryale.AAC.2
MSYTRGADVPPEWSHVARVVACGPSGRMPPEWSHAARVVACRPSGRMPPEWSHAARVVACRPSGGMRTRGAGASPVWLPAHKRSWCGALLVAARWRWPPPGCRDTGLRALSGGNRADACLSDACLSATSLPVPMYAALPYARRPAVCASPACARPHFCPCRTLDFSRA